MTLPPDNPVVHVPAVTAVDGMRLYRRFALDLGGRFMRACRSEHTCRTLDVSVGGLSLAAGADVAGDVAIGERIVAYVDQIGGVEGTVVRVWSDGFAIRIDATPHKREKLAAALTILVNASDMDDFAARRHERITVAQPVTTITLAEGVDVPCLLIELFASGATLACATRPDVGLEAWLGGFRARIVRHHDEGIGLQFMDGVDAETLADHFSR